MDGDGVTEEKAAKPVRRCSRLRFNTSKRETMGYFWQDLRVTSSCVLGDKDG